MDKCLLSIDWDYFIRAQWDKLGSCTENNKNLINAWYKRYFQWKMSGRDIKKSFELSPEVEIFWDEIKEHFKFMDNIKGYVSDSHALSYDIARENGCNDVYLFDAHADLGYGGLSSLNFEVNCANWFGKLLKSRQVEKANIIYSPYTCEKPEYFNQINNIFHVKYSDMGHLDKGIKVATIHICRSGAWTPPWLDEKFTQFVRNSGIRYKIIDCPKRKWDTRNLSLADQIYYSMA